MVILIALIIRVVSVGRASAGPPLPDAGLIGHNDGLCWSFFIILIEAGEYQSPQVRAGPMNSSGFFSF